MLGEDVNQRAPEHSTGPTPAGRGQQWLARTLSAPIVWYSAVWLAGAVVLLRASLGLMARLPAGGDEPWYLLQTYTLLHYHTPDLAGVLRDHSVYARFLGAQVDDHSFDYVGNGERVLSYLPGYAVLIVPAYALGGRTLVGAMQALVAAVTGVLVFGAAWRIFGSRLVAVCAWLAFLVPLPVLLYAGQIFPSTLAACAAMLGFVLASGPLRRARGWRLVLAGVALGMVAGLLPWLHIKYALAALALIAVAIWTLWPRTGWRPRRRSRTRATIPVPTNTPAAPVPMPMPVPVPVDIWWVRAALAGVCALFALSAGLIAAYSRHYFGSWTPPNGLTQPDWLHPQWGAVFAVYADMFVGRESGLLPWVPLALLAVPGVVLLWRRSPALGSALALLLAGQLGTFVTAAVSPVAQAKAMPARFTVESLPLLALCAAAVFAVGLPALRQWFARAARWDSGALLQPDAAARLTRRELGARTVVGLVACVLLAATAWFGAVGQRDPALLYPSPAGPRVVAEYSHALPGAWFALFPSVAPEQWVTHGVLALHPASPGAMVGMGVPEAGAVLGMPGHLPAGARLATSGALLAPAGAYVATLAFACAPLPPGARTATTIARVSVLNPWDHARPVVAAGELAATNCQGLARPQTAALPFNSDGYRPLTFLVTFAGATSVAVLYVAYAPA